MTPAPSACVRCLAGFASGASSATLAATRPGLAATRPGLAATRPGLAATRPGLAATRPGLAATRPGLAATRPGARRALRPQLPYWRRRHFCSSQRLNEKTNVEPLRSRHGGAKGVGNGNDVYSDVAFAFDIDGVLYQGHQSIPGAREVLRKIRSLDMRYVFLTNGGGAHEDAKAASLTKRLQMSHDEDVIHNRIIVSHTPMRGWPDSVKEQTVLITGAHPETARQLANEYGFSRAVTPADLIHDNNKIYPFDQLKDSLHSRHRPLPDGKSASRVADAYSRDIPADALKIDQILVWNDPRDWSLDIQVIHDLLLSHQGYLGTVSDKNGDHSQPNNGWQQDGQPDLWISNLDLVWKTEYPVNRFGTGAFVEALKGVWSAVTGGAELQFKALGKPSKLTYDYAHQRLLDYYSDTRAAPADVSGRADTDRQRRLRRVYMIGDNPESDIRGANDFCPDDGTEWVPILVRTGVWRQAAADKEPRHRPAVIVDDVVDAIAWALRNEGVQVSRDWLVSGKD